MRHDPSGRAQPGLSALMHSGHGRLVGYAICSSLALQTGFSGSRLVTDYQTQCRETGAHVVVGGVVRAARCQPVVQFKSAVQHARGTK